MFGYFAYFTLSCLAFNCVKIIISYFITCFEHKMILCNRITISFIVDLNEVEKIHVGLVIKDQPCNLIRGGGFFFNYIHTFFAQNSRIFMLKFDKRLNAILKLTKM